MRILFICLGNICRSSAAEEILRQKLIDSGLSERVKVDSAGLINYHEGELPDVGLVELEDSETGELMLVDTSSAKVRKAFAAKAESDREELTKFFRKTGIDTLDIATDKPYIDGVRALFKRRARKR